ncbi:PREDICTED: 28S ribosomal protein S26, mitochondrial-like [Gavialis gangeticus]|uniref:28S ribosomal protein S26, mitochondrial-like n=1 Tax=Gavialis gangeticus TaxID=94835 RepID=UPI00092EF388|nr:PREDICTED: 28S ribosomal protein S26, mitochondrial-like [Gavialis gangeticus]
MACPRSLLLLLVLLLAIGVPLARAQHWSHGWYPGGKRELDLSQAPQVRPAWSPVLVPARGRKTRYDPPAKSKAERVKVPPPVDPAELLVVQERYRQYYSVVRALRSVFRAEAAQKKREHLSNIHEESEIDEALMAWNDAENEQQLRRREERIRREEEELEKQKLQGAISQAKLMEDFMKEKEKEVLQLQEEARTFITPENLDERIEQCLDNPQNYNFAIDKEQRIIRRTSLS